MKEQGLLRDREKERCLERWMVQEERETDRAAGGTDREPGRCWEVKWREEILVHPMPVPTLSDAHTFGLRLCTADHIHSKQTLQEEERKYHKGPAEPKYTHPLHPVYPRLTEASLTFESPLWFTANQHIRGHTVTHMNATTMKNLALAFQRGAFKNSHGKALTALCMPSFLCSDPMQEYASSRSALLPGSAGGRTLAKGRGAPHLKSICFILNWCLGPRLRLANATVTAIEILGL